MYYTTKCDGIDKDLQAGLTLVGLIDKYNAGKFNPQEIGGWRPGEGDTHRNQILDVPDCPEE